MSHDVRYCLCLGIYTKQRHLPEHPHSLVRVFTAWGNLGSSAIQRAPREDNQGPVVQSIISLRSSLVVKMLTALVNKVSNSHVFLLK